MNRAKTRRSEVPDKCRVLRAIDVMPTYIVFGFDHPVNGGSDINCFVIQFEDVDMHKTDMIRVLPYTNEHKIEHLRPGAKYRACIRADNKVGSGEYSNWTKVISLPVNFDSVGKKK
jgi:hypothetical protein